jgi:hypothetical protein
LNGAVATLAFGLFVLGAGCCSGSVPSSCVVVRPSQTARSAGNAAGHPVTDAQQPASAHAAKTKAINRKRTMGQNLKTLGYA